MGTFGPLLPQTLIQASATVIVALVSAGGAVPRSAMTLAVNADSDE